MTIIAEPHPGGRWRARALVALVALVGPLAVYADRWLVLLVLLLAGAASAAPGRIAGALLAAARRPLGLSVLALLGWSALSVAWAPAPGEALADLGPRLLLAAAGLWLVGAGARLAAGERRAARAALAGTVIGLVVLLAVEVLSGGALIHRLRPGLDPGIAFANHSGAVLAVLLWPAAGLLAARTRAGAALLVTGALAVLAAVPMDAAPLAALAAGAAVLAARRLGRAAVGALGVAVVLLGLGAPWAVRALGASPVLPEIAAALPQSWAHRLLIWEFTASGGAGALLRGHGFRSAHDRAGRGAARQRYRALAAKYRRADLAAEPPLHPHSVIFQLWYELGALGVAAALAILVLGLRGIAGRLGRDPAAPWELGALVAFLFVASLSFGAWQAWWMASGLLAAAFCALARAPAGGRSR